MHHLNQPASRDLDKFNLKVAYSIRDAARLLGISPTTLYNEIQQARITTYQVGRRRFISGWALIKWIECREDKTLNKDKGAPSHGTASSLKV